MRRFQGVTRERRPRVAMISANFFPYVGGAEAQALSLSKALVAQGVDVTVVTRRVQGACRETLDGVDVRRLAVLGTGVADSFCFMAGLVGWLFAHARSYDAIHVHLAGSPALAAMLAAGLLGKRLVIKLGGGRGIGELAVSNESAAGRLKLGVFRALKPRFVAVTEDLKEELRAFGIDSQVEIQPNGVDTARFKPAGAEAKKELRRRLGWADETTFLYMGRLSAEKQLPRLIAAFKDALDQGANARLVLAGAGPEEPAARRALERAAGERIRLLPPTAEPEAFYGAADVFVLPSLSEGLSNALLEAMACALGVIASRVGGTPTVVADGKTGVLFEASDMAALTRAIVDLARNPRKAESMGAKARELVVTNYGIDAVAKNYKRLYGF